MISEEMLHEAASRSNDVFLDFLSRDYTDTHSFSLAFERKIKRLKRKADHPILHQALNRVASILLALVVGSGVWLAFDTQARASFFGWIKNVYETFFVYQLYEDDGISTNAKDYAPSWVPNGYEESRRSDSGSTLTIVYTNTAGQKIRFTHIYDPGAESIFVDADGGTIKSTKIRGYDANLILFESTEKANNILWTDAENRAFHISAFLSEDDLLKMATSVYSKDF